MVQASYGTTSTNQIVSAGHGIVFNLGGPIVESLSTSADEDAYSVIKGTLRPGTGVLLHSHYDPESCYILSGRAELLAETASGLEWQEVQQGDFVHIPPGMKHAWRNLSDSPMEAVISMTPKLGQFLRELGALIQNKGFALERIRELERRYGYWSGTVEENDAVGIAILSP